MWGSENKEGKRINTSLLGFRVKAVNSQYVKTLLSSVILLPAMISFFFFVRIVQKFRLLGNKVINLYS